MLFHDESSITKGGYESAIAPILVGIASYIPKSFITEKTPIAQLFDKTQLLVFAGNDTFDRKHHSR